MTCVAAPLPSVPTLRAGSGCEGKAPRTATPPDGSSVPVTDLVPVYVKTAVSFRKTKIAQIIPFQDYFHRVPRVSV